MLQGFLEGKVDGSDAILETVSFLDHLLREGPSHKYTQIKKNFFVSHAQ
jgi:eukaryotic translation initiation factor 2C